MKKTSWPPALYYLHRRKIDSYSLRLHSTILSSSTVPYRARARCLIKYTARSHALNQRPYHLRRLILPGSIQLSAEQCLACETPWAICLAHLRDVEVNISTVVAFGSTMDSVNHIDEQRHLLPRKSRRFSRLQSIVADEIDGVSVVSSHVSKEEHALGGTAVGERLPYNDYTTIDWLHDLVSIAWRAIITLLTRS